MSLHELETVVYGTTATVREQQERSRTVLALLDCHAQIVMVVMVANLKDEPLFILANEACGDLLQTIAKLLHTDAATVQQNLLNLPFQRRAEVVTSFVTGIRQPQDVAP